METKHTDNETEVNSYKWTEVILNTGDTVIPAVLNDSRSSRELIERLPYTVKINKYEHDYCGIMNDPLSYNKKDLHSGWKNGDIAFAANGSYFAILYKDEEISEDFDNLVTLGKLGVNPSIMGTLNSSISVTIELK